MKTAFVAIVCILLVGCASVPYRVGPDLEQRRGSLKRVVLLPPKVDIYELSAGGSAEKMDEWSQQGERNVVAALRSIVKPKSSMSLDFLDTTASPPSQRAAIQETNAIYQAVDRSVIMHAYDGLDKFDYKVKSFDYSLGEETARIDSTADAYLLVRGVDHVSSGGRVALQAAAMIFGALAGVTVTPQGGVTALSVSLVDGHSGNVLWHTAFARPGEFDLREERSTTSILEKMLKDFPVQ